LNAARRRWRGPELPVDYLDRLHEIIRQALDTIAELKAQT